MGNFYTNFTVLGADGEAVLEVARRLGRSVYVIDSRAGDAVLYDQTCDEQNVGDIETLGATLSTELSAPVVATLNHDDDHLLIWVFVDGMRRGFYESFVDAPLFSWRLSAVRGGVFAYPLILVILGWPIVLLQFWRHSALVRLLSLPSAAVSYGYRYIARGEVPEGYSKDEIKSA